MLALGLAAVGIYGVLSYLVSQRQREIGVRLALGARRTDIVAMILREGLTFMIVGAAVGLVAAVALGRVLSHVLFGTMIRTYSDVPTPMIRRIDSR